MINDSTNCGNFTNKNYNQGGCGNARRGGNKNTPENATLRRLSTNKLCWTHYGCNHYSSKCLTRAPGHKENATRASKKGWSLDFCHEKA